MPAQSPTLSPTLSAITAGFLGSSSGIPASTLPTKSAPTSAPLVKIPPPSLANIEISEAPNPRATSACLSVSSDTEYESKMAYYTDIDNKAKRATSIPATAPALKATFRPFPKLSLAA